MIFVWKEKKRKVDQALTQDIIKVPIFRESLKLENMKTSNNGISEFKFFVKVRYRIPEKNEFLKIFRAWITEKIGISERNFDFQKI